MRETVDLKINFAFATHEEGDILTLPAYGGLPTDSYWRRRLQDAKIDNCCELVKAPKRAPKGQAGTAKGDD